jgi:hypothetical protein
LADDVAAELEHFKDKINVSRVCARAVKEEIEHMRLLERSLQDADANLARLRVEKALAHADDENAGRQAAAAAVARISYGELVGAARIGDLDAWSTGLFDLLPHWARVEFEDHESDAALDPVGTEPALDPQIFARGWLSFMQAYWMRIKDQL